MNNNKQIKFSDEAKTLIKEGIDLVTNAVKVTLGPKGQNVIIGRQSGSPHITKDGVTVAKEISLKDPFRNIGVNLIKEIASKTCKDVGDGTTTATILAHSIIEQGMKCIKSGYNPILLKNEIEAATEKVVKYIQSLSIPIESDENYIKYIATISANNDSIIGELISNTIEKITKDGVIVVEESQNMETYVDIIKGMQFDRGYLAPHFITDDIRNECVYEKVRILITDMKINYMRDLVGILEQLVHKNESLLIIAEDYDPSVIENLKLNKLQNILNIVPVQAPSFGEYRKDILQDIAILTEGTVISYETHKLISSADINNLGYCDKVIVTKDKTTIIGGKGNVDSRVEHLKTKLKTESSEIVKDMIQQRIAKLIGGIGVMYVGGTTEIEMKERKDRIDDALQATRAAIEEGIVVGGGITYIKITNLFTYCETEGELIIYNSLHTPFRQIVINAGQEDNFERIFNEITLKQKLSYSLDNFGYNAKTDKIEDLLEAGVIDPTKVAITALRNAVSVATLLLTTECLIVDEPIEVINMF